VVLFLGAVKKGANLRLVALAAFIAENPLVLVRVVKSLYRCVALSTAQALGAHFPAMVEVVLI